MQRYTAPTVKLLPMQKAGPAQIKGQPAKTTGQQQHHGKGSRTEHVEAWQVRGKVGQGKGEWEGGTGGGGVVIGYLRAGGM